MTETGFVPDEYIRTSRTYLKEMNIKTNVQPDGNTTYDRNYIDSTRYTIHAEDFLNEKESETVGGQGIVVLGRDEKFGREAAFKFLKPSDYLSKTPEERAEIDAFFKREVDSLANLSHHHIAKVFDAVGYDHEGVMIPGMYMEPLKPLRSMSYEEISLMTKQVADALDYMHAQGVIHSDVKLNNIMIREHQGREDFVLTDMGAVFKRATGEHIGDIGTEGYRDPQRIKYGSHDQHLLERSDQYALAASIYSFLTGEYNPPIKVDVMNEHNVILLNQELSKPILDVLKKALAYEREDRYESCTSFAKALEQAMAQPEKEQSVGGKVRSFTELPARISQKTIP